MIHKEKRKEVGPKVVNVITNNLDGGVIKGHVESTGNTKMDIVSEKRIRLVPAILRWCVSSNWFVQQKRQPVSWALEWSLRCPK